ncbi:helicase associated domain-containing protein, partial [Acidithiobacillus ferriphilus]|nr:helicase associated domain-containing protein [Acidithiobacillus ferriphilus]
MALDELLFPFDHGFRRLSEFVCREGHARVPTSHIEPDGFRLGNWVGARRKDYRMGRLTPERIAELEAVPGWVWSILEDDWDRGVAALRAFVEREGHAKIPKRHVTQDGLRLGTWVGSRRVEYLENRLAIERIAELEAVPGWVWSILEDGWDRSVAALHAFVEREGHARVPTSHIEPDGFKLGSWVSDRRKDYRMGRLTPERIA